MTPSFSLIIKDYSSLSADELVALQQGVPVDPSPADTDMTTTASVRNKLQSLNPAKAPGPDGIPKSTYTPFTPTLKPV